MNEPTPIPAVRIVPANNLPADAPWWARWLQAEARDAWKWSNTYLVGLMGAIPLAYETVPGLQALVPVAWVHYVNGALALITFFNLIRRKAGANGAPPPTVANPNLVKAPPL